MAAGMRGPGEKADETLEAMNNVAMVDTDRGKYEEAEALYQKILKIQQEKAGPDTPVAMMTLNNLGQLYLTQDRLPDAERVTTDALAGCRRVLGNEHNLTLTCINNLAVIERRMKRMDQAEPLYREAYETSRRTLGETSVSTLLPLVNLARFYQAAGRCATESAFVERAVAVSKEHAPAESPILATALRIQGECRVARGDLAGAEAPLVDAERRFSKLFPGDVSKLRDLREEIASLYDKLGRGDSARAWRAKSGPEDGEVNHQK